jgi:hypothetical protein
MRLRLRVCSRRIDEGWLARGNWQHGLAVGQAGDRAWLVVSRYVMEVLGNADVRFRLEDLRCIWIGKSWSE